MQYIIIILLIIVIILSYVVNNLLRKIEKYEDRIEFYEKIINDQQEYVKRVSSMISDSREFIRQVDDRGIFEADDDVGMFFRYLKEIQEALSTFIITEINGKSKE